MGISVKSVPFIYFAVHPQYIEHRINLQADKKLKYHIYFSTAGVVVPNPTCGHEFEYHHAIISCRGGLERSVAAAEAGLFDERDFFSMSTLEIKDTTYSYDPSPSSVIVTTESHGTG